MHLKLHGGATVYLDGVEQQPVAYAGVTGVTVMEVNLSLPTALRRVCTLCVETRHGYRAGGILDAPVRFEMVTGVMKVGSWEEQGLVGYGGGVRYGQTLGPYMEAISPTSFVFPGQTVSGLFGPVTLTETGGE